MRNYKNDTIELNLDFDGTCVTHDFPRIGKDIGSVSVLKKLTNRGHRLILFTMRSDNNGLTDAINWFKNNDIPLYGVQTNPSQLSWTTSPKSYAELMIDDSALGCPLVFDKNISPRPFVDWVKVEEMLINMNLI